MVQHSKNHIERWELGLYSGGTYITDDRGILC